MYIHLGMGVVVREEDVVGIFDMENTTVSGATRDFLKRAQKENLVEDVCYDLPRSIVFAETRSAASACISRRLPRPRF